MSQPPETSVIDTLTRRERDVVALLVEGVTTNAAIAERLVVSSSTVHFHLANIMLKLNVHDRSQIVSYAYTAGRRAAPPT